MVLEMVPHFLSLRIERILDRIADMPNRLPSTMDGGDPGLAALRLIEGYIFFCVAHQVPKKKPAEKNFFLLIIVFSVWRNHIFPHTRHTRFNLPVLGHVHQKPAKNP